MSNLHLLARSDLCRSWGGTGLLALLGTGPSCSGRRGLGAAGWPQPAWTCCSVLVPFRAAAQTPRGCQHRCQAHVTLAGRENFGRLVTEMPWNKSVNCRACCPCEFYLAFVFKFVIRLLNNSNWNGPVQGPLPKRCHL